MKILDLGVGCGRTTHFFSKNSKEYIGVDYSKKMIEICKKTFSNSSNVSFKVLDVRDMSCFENNYFDFILFSFNGIDYISNEDRLKTLKEIKRMGKKNSILFFSTHNLNSSKSFKFPFSCNPLILGLRSIKKLFYLFINFGFMVRRKLDYAIIRDDAHDFKLKTYYINPLEQVKQLQQIGFKEIKIYSFETRKEVEISEINGLKDKWLYYFCKI